MNRAGRRSRPDRVDEDCGIGAVERLDQIDSRAVGRDHLAVGRRRGGENSRDLDSDGIVAERASDSDDSNQRFSISSFRK
jgi:hypothetical protein